MTHTLAIIGTAGRGEDIYLLSAAHYERMLEASFKLLNHVFSDRRAVSLVSGGAAWADPLVVDLALRGYVKPEQVTLYLPCSFNFVGTSPQFVGTNKQSEKTASTINHYHHLFSQKVEGNSLADIRSLQEQGGNLIVGNGFKYRNSQIASAVTPGGVLLAFTFGHSWTRQHPWVMRRIDGSVSARDAGLKPGGTSDTFNKAEGCLNRWHCLLGPMNERWSDEYTS